MNRCVVWVMSVLFVSMLSPALAEETLSPVMDIVTLKDGSVIYGEVVEMEKGILRSWNRSFSK